MARAAQLNLPLTLTPVDFNRPPAAHAAGHCGILPVKLRTPVTTGQLNVANAPYVLECLDIATTHCLAERAQALVTGPVQKSIMNLAGIPFQGHTEYLAERTGAAMAIMLFVVDDMKVALATTHLPLAEVPKHITTAGLITLIRSLHQALRHQFGIGAPRITVTGLNPHAGENGVLGREEINTIMPALNALRAEQIDVRGPLPADTIFIPAELSRTDVVVAMYHDQALPVVKYRGFDHAVNVTLGLPIIRTSVDHGTALTLAGTGAAQPGSLQAALLLAIKLAKTKASTVA
jgi:4-hydroxythreonine-4-phosphate dehydrogenase